MSDVHDFMERLALREAEKQEKEALALAIEEEKKQEKRSNVLAAQGVPQTDWQCLAHVLGVQAKMMQTGQALALGLNGVNALMLGGIKV